MALLARHTPKLVSRFAYGAIIYWGLNLVLVGAELRWHFLYHLTVWDVAQLKTLVPALAKLAHLALAGSASGLR